MSKQDEREEFKLVMELVQERNGLKERVRELEGALRKLLETEAAEVSWVGWDYTEEYEKVREEARLALERPEREAREKEWKEESERVWAKAEELIANLKQQTGG